MIVTNVIINRESASIKIKPIADVHYGSTYCDIKAFQEFLGDSDDDTFFIGIGDLLDSIVVTDKRYSKSNDSTETDAIINEVSYEIVKILEPYRKRIIGLGRGNHEQTLINKCNTDVVDLVCRFLDIRYLGYSFLVELVFNGKSVLIRGHHGWGGGSRTQGGNLTKFSKDLITNDADIYLFGHVHQLQYDRIDQMVYRDGKIVSRPKLVCICGTFQKTLAINSVDASYAEVKGYPATAIGGLEIIIKDMGNGLDITAQTHKYTEEL